MIRLTELVGDNWIVRQERINGKYPTDREVYNKLAKYEDLEEQGLLIKLPCKVGDTAILTFDDFGEFFITEGWQLVEITILEDDIMFDFKCYSTNDEEERSLKDFGKTVFLTREEAQKSIERIC